jgi:hypothetical protein
MNNLFWLTALVMVESIQLLIAIIYFNTFFPPTSPMQGQVLTEWLHDLQPEREMFLYRIFIMTAIIFQAAAVYRFRSMLADADWGRQLRRFLAVESLVLVLLCYVIFKVLVYHHPYLTQFFWPALLVIALSIKIFWGPLNRASRVLLEFVHYPANTLPLRMMLDIAVPIFIFLVIYLPNQEGALARTFMEEQFHHFDTLIMVPAFASSMGCLLNVDVNSQYGVGMPMMMGFLAKCMGGVTYGHILELLMIGCILYYWLVYAFLRIWLKSALLSAIGIVIGLKWQMFHTGMYPFIFGIPNGLVVRYFWDIIFFMLLYRHIHKQESWALLLLSVCAGGSVFYVSDTGGSLILAFYVYLLYLLAANYFFKGMDWGANIWSLVRYFLIVPCVTIGLFWLALGNNVFHPTFWNNMKEFLQFFLDGYEALPIYQSLTDHNYLQCLVGFMIPAVYMLTFLVVGSLVLLRKIKPENVLVVILSAYGMGLYHYFVCRSASTQYYVECLPYVFILCFWLKSALSVLTQYKRRNILLALLAFCMFALLTTHQFIVYPNMLNISRNPFTDPLSRPEYPGLKYYFNHLFTRIPEELKLPVNSLGQTDEEWKTEDDFRSDEELVDYYHKEFDLSQDADLIARLTPPDGRAAVMSSFDIRLLMQAKRKPFFYCFPLLVERPMRMRNFPSTHLHTIARLQRTLKQIAEDKPEYIFMERIFLIDKVSQDFYNWSSDTIALINYVRAYYEPYQQGYYLVAMKRKANL